jgi:hypothetical protein
MDPSQKATYLEEKVLKKLWPGLIVIVANIPAIISIMRQLRSLMNSDRGQDRPDKAVQGYEDLGFHRRARPEQIDHHRNNQSAEIQHPAQDHPILRRTPTGWNLRQGQPPFRPSQTQTEARKKTSGDGKTGGLNAQVDQDNAFSYYCSSQLPAIISSLIFAHTPTLSHQTALSRFCLLLK